MASVPPSPSPSPSPSRPNHSRSASAVHQQMHVATQAPALTEPSAPPANNIHSATARIYSFAHPIILVAIYTSRFPKLVADPINGLVNNLPLLVLLQIAYVMVCLPPAGTTSSSTLQSRADGDGDGDAKRIPVSPSPGMVLRAGKVRRKHHKNDGGSMSAKLTVCE